MGRLEIKKMEENRDVKGLIKSLGDLFDGFEARDALVRIGRSAIEPLIQALKKRES